MKTLSSIIFHTIIAVTVLFLITLPAQSNSSVSLLDTTLANEYFVIADSLAQKTQFDSSIAYFTKAALIYEALAYQTDEQGLWEKYIRCRIQIGENYRRKKEYNNALVYITRALEVGLTKLGEYHPDIAAGYNKIGIIYSNKFDYDRALKYENKALAILKNIYGENHLTVAESYNDAGILYMNKGNYDLALEYLQKALAIKINLLGENDVNLASTYFSIGNLYASNGDHDYAISYFNKTLNIVTSTSSEDYRGWIGPINVNLGLCYAEKGDYDKALEHWEKSLTAKLQTLPENHPSIAKSYANIGTVYYHRGDYDRALEYYDRASDIYSQSIGNYHYYTPFIASNYDNYGDIYTAKGEYDKALNYYQKSLNILKEYFGDSHNNVGYLYEQIGKIYAKQKEFQKALNYYQKSLTIFVPDFADSNVYHNPIVKNATFRMAILSVLALKAEAFNGLYSTGKSHGEEKSQKLIDIRMSISTYQLISELIDEMRSGFKEEGTKLHLGKEASKIFDKAIQTALQIYELTKEEDYQKIAFEFNEKSRAAVLSQSLQESLAKKFAGIPDSLLNKEKKIRIDLAYYETKVQDKKLDLENQDSLEIRSLENQYFELKNDHNNLIERFENFFPKFYNLKFQTHTASVSDLQAALDNKTSLLEYFLGDSSIYIFALTQTGFLIKTVKRDSGLNALIDSLATSFRNVTSKNAYLRSANKLYQLLIKPVEYLITAKPRWVIIPDGELYQIPFEVLLSESISLSADIEYMKLNYLIRQHEISYHYSATLYLKSLQEKTTGSYTHDFIGFAPVFSELVNNRTILSFDPASFLTIAQPDAYSYLITRDGKNLEALPHSEEEIQNIQRLFPNRGHIYLYDDASEENFKKKVSNTRFIHIATHGFINNKNPKLSNLAFSQEQDSEWAEDGILFSGETYNLDLNADLVVLSACQSGFGQIVRGEGLMGLTRGFLYSGASNIIASLWKVPDKHTSQLMVELYRQILADKTYPAALREAKLKMIADPATAAPQSWASFVLIGR